MNLVLVRLALLALIVCPNAVGAQMPVAATGADRVGSPTQVLDVNVARRISADDVKKRMDAGETAILVDARSVFSGPMIKGAVQVPGEKLAAWAKEIPKDAFIVTYCTCPAEHSAANHVVQLQKYGFTNAYALLGGLRAWQDALLPTEPGPQQAPNPAPPQ